MLKKLIKKPDPVPELELPIYSEMEQTVTSICYKGKSDIDWYPPLFASSATISTMLFNSKYIQAGIELMEKLEKDDYTHYLIDYYKAGLESFGDGWRYADIVTVLLCLSDTLKPKNYLEIGVRRGRSVCAVSSKTPDCDLYMFDQWRQGYAGMDNPGPELVQQELDKVGHNGKRTIVSGNSHSTLKKFLNKNRNIAFDLITVDGDHSYEGAAEDLCDVLPRLKIGGAVVFDDISHPKHLYLNKVWSKLVETDVRFASWRFTDTGYGVGFALRKW
jgi:predicted O-methyltransferase YrrM